MEDRRRPDFIVISSARCGTTSLWKWFLKHPWVYILFYSKSKEGAKKERKKDRGIVKGVIFEDQLTNPSFPQILKHLYKGRTKLIFFLRNPAERAFSLWKFMLREGLEWKSDFEEALAQESKRFYNPPELIRERIEHFWSYMYWHGGLYHIPIKRFYDIFGESFMRSNTRIYTYEAMLSKPQEIFRDICNFLDIENPKLEVNFISEGRWENKIPSFPQIQFILRLVVDKLNCNLQGFYSKVIRDLITALMKLNILSGKNLGEHWLVDFLKEAYREDVEKLSTLTEIDFFDIWYNVGLSS